MRNPLMEPIGNPIDPVYRRPIYGDAGSLIGAGASIVGGLMSSDASSSAADAQSAAAASATQEQAREYNLNRQDLAPYRNIGSSAINQLSYLLGISGNPTGSTGSSSLTDPTKVQDTGAQGGRDFLYEAAKQRGQLAAYYQLLNSGQLDAASSGSKSDKLNLMSSTQNQLMSQFSNQSTTPQVNTSLGGYGSLLTPFSKTDWTTDPGYQFRLGQGLESVENSASARGMQLSGNTLKGLEEYGQNFASNEYQNVYNRYNTDQTNLYNRLSGVAGLGQQATNATVNAGQNSANSISNSILAGGNAQAAGIVGSANALSSGLSNAANNYQQQYYLKNLFGGGTNSIPFLDTSVVDSGYYNQ